MMMMNIHIKIRKGYYWDSLILLKIPVKSVVFCALPYNIYKNVHMYMNVCCMYFNRFLVSIPCLSPHIIWEDVSGKNVDCAIRTMYTSLIVQYMSKRKNTKVNPHYYLTFLLLNYSTLVGENTHFFYYEAPNRFCK